MGIKYFGYHLIVQTLILLKNVGMGKSKKEKGKKWLVNSIDKLFSRFFNECIGH